MPARTTSWKAAPRSLRAAWLELAAVTRDTSSLLESEYPLSDPSHPFDPVPPLPCLHHRPVLRLEPLYTQPRPFRTLDNQCSRLA